MDLIFRGKNGTVGGVAGFGSSDKSDESASIGESALIGIICGIGIFVINSLTLGAIVHYDYVKETYISLIKSLCVADALTGVSLIMSVLDSNLKLTSNELCCMHPGYYFYQLFAGSPPHVSHWHTVALSVDRLLAVHFALRYHSIMTPKRMMIMTVSAWFLGFLDIGVARILRWHKLCIGNARSFHVPDIMGTLHLLFIFMINAAIYAHLWKIARKHRKQIANQQVEEGTGQSKSPAVDKSTIMVIGIVGLFAIMWGPYFIAELALIFVDNSVKEDLSSISRKYLIILGYCNTVLNNVVYVVMNNSLRKSIAKQCPCSKN